MALSDLIVRQAKAADKTYTLPDTDSLGLTIYPTGRKSWHLRYYWLGKQKRISLGSYPEISLREARTLRDEARALLAKGINPHTDRKQKRHAVKLASDYTFKAVFDAWVEHRAKELKEGRNSTLSQIKRIFKKDVLPSLGKMSIYDIRRPQLLGVQARIEKRKAFTTAEKVRTWLGHPLQIPAQAGVVEVVARTFLRGACRRVLGHAIQQIESTHDQGELAVLVGRALRHSAYRVPRSRRRLGASKATNQAARQREAREASPATWWRKQTETGESHHADPNGGEWLDAARSGRIAPA